MSWVSTHVLDTATGMPAVGLRVQLSNGPDPGELLADEVTDADGRIAIIGPDPLRAGHYRLRFNSGDYHRSQGVSPFYPEVIVHFLITDDSGHLHLPLLLSPFAYSTYRGS